MENSCRVEARALRRAHRLLAAGLFLVAGCRRHVAPPTPQWTDIGLAPQDRLLILAPHPDDEVLCCGGIIQQAVARGVPVRVVFFTYGDNNQWSFLLYRKHPVFLPSGIRKMGLVRHDEAVAATNALKLSPEHLTFLGYPDFGTLQIWRNHWGDQAPFRSMLTRVTQVPYANALRPGAAYKGEEIVQDLTTILRDVRPTKVFISHPGDYMPDHAALYLFTRIALWDVESEMRPELYPYLIHFKRWPKPRGFCPTELLQPPIAFKSDNVTWHSHLLSQSEVEQKRIAVRAHRTQYAYSAAYLLSFVRPNELFGDFPVVRLEQSTLPARLSPNAGMPPEEEEAPEQLTYEERGVFVGLEERSVRLDNGALVLSVQFSRPLAAAVKASVFVFGYRPDRPFAQMPKLHLVFGELHHETFDQDRRLPNGTVHVTRERKSLTIRIPLNVLGDPQRVLTSASTYLGDVPLDWAAWRTLDLGAAPAPVLAQPPVLLAPASESALPPASSSPSTQ